MMLEDSGAVQFLDLVGGHWRLESGHVGNAEACSGCIGGATAGMPTAVRRADDRGDAGPHELPIDATVNLMRAAKTIATSSVRPGRSGALIQAWGIMAPRS